MFKLDYKTKIIVDKMFKKYINFKNLFYLCAYLIIYNVLIYEVHLSYNNQFRFL